MSSEPKRVELLQGTLDLIVLRALSTMGPQHAYGLAARLEQVGDHPLMLNQGTLYPALVRLEQRGWIKGTWQKTDSNRDAKYYDITKAGTRALEKQTERWRSFAASSTSCCCRLVTRGFPSPFPFPACEPLPPGRADLIWRASWIPPGARSRPRAPRPDAGSRAGGCPAHGCVHGHQCHTLQGLPAGPRERPTYLHDVGPGPLRCISGLRGLEGPSEIVFAGWPSSTACSRR